QLVDVEFFLAYSGAERRDERADLGGRQHFVEACLLDVEDLALQRQDPLRAPVPPLLCRAAGGITLDDEDLRERRVLLLTVGELAREPGHIECTLTAGH